LAIEDSHQNQTKIYILLSSLQ